MSSNAHAALADARVRVHLLEDLVDVSRVRFGALAARAAALAGLLGGLGGLLGGGLGHLVGGVF